MKKRQRKKNWGKHFNLAGKKESANTLTKVMFMSKKSENDVLKIVHGLSCRHLRGRWLTSAFAERRMTGRNTVKSGKSVRCARAHGD